MLRERLKVAIPLLAVVFLCFFLPGNWGRSAFALLAAVLLFGANHEGCQLCGFLPWKKEELLLDAFALALIGNAWMQFFPGPVLLMAFLLLAFALYFGQEVTRKSLENTAKVILVGTLVCWALSFMAQIFYQFGPTGPALLAFLVVVTKVADIGAYAVGSATAKLPGGNHKLCPFVSPKKSWEGLLGGIAASVVVAELFVIFGHNSMMVGVLDLTWLNAILLGFVAATVGLLGDLCESLLKRAAGAKDSGKIPGLGGVLDMVDSLLPMGALLYAWLSY